MVKPARGWWTLHRVALVVIGWLFFAAGVVIENVPLKFLFLVAARALPHALQQVTIIVRHPGPAVRRC